MSFSMFCDCDLYRCYTEHGFSLLIIPPLTKLGGIMFCTRPCFSLLIRSGTFSHDVLHNHHHHHHYQRLFLIKFIEYAVEISYCLNSTCMDLKAELSKTVHSPYLVLTFVLFDIFSWWR
jgi:hypothetical protein